MPSGEVRYLENLFGREWIKSLKISEDIDSPSMTLDMDVQREWERYSLSPLMTSLGLPVFWSGTAWRNAAGAAA